MGWVVDAAGAGWRRRPAPSSARRENRGSRVTCSVDITDTESPWLNPTDLVITQVQINSREGEKGVGFQSANFVVWKTESWDWRMDFGMKEKWGERGEAIPLQIHVTQLPVGVESVLAGIPTEIKIKLDPARYTRYSRTRESLISLWGNGV